MNQSFPNKETPLIKELVIWLLIATALAIFNWFIYSQSYSEDPNSSLKLLIVHLAYSYFVFLHILILVAVFRTLFLDRLRSTNRIIQKLTGLFFAFIGFLVGMYNMQWFANYAHSFMFPNQSISFSISNSLIYWMGIFVAIGIIGIFAVSYYSMRLNLKASYRIHLERERLRGELETAREMQMGIMPSKAPDVSGVDIAGICLPATEVGGDYFDYFQKNGSEHELGFTVADVSGKGMKAAMTAVMVSGMLHAEAARELKADDMLTHINAPLYQKNRPQNVHSPALSGSLDLKQMRFTFTNAGQMPPMLLRDGRLRS